MNASLVYQSAMAAALAAPVESESDWIESAHGFARIKTAAGGFVSLKNCAVRLRDFADTVRKNWQAFGAGPKPAELVKPKKPRGAIAWPAVTLKVWRELIEAGQHAEALELGAEKLGLRCYIGSGPFAVAAPMPVEGLSEFFASGRRDDGRFIVYDTVSGVSIGARGAASRKSAEESAREMWNDRTEEQHETALRSARNMYRTGPEAARIAWMKHHGIACDDAPQSEPEPIADDAEPAAEVIQPAPVNPEPDPAEPAADRYSFDIHLIEAGRPGYAGGHRIASETYTCAGPGLTSADIRGAAARLREMAADRGLRVVMDGFGNGQAQAWAEPIAPPVNPNPEPIKPAAPDVAPDVAPEPAAPDSTEAAPAFDFGLTYSVHVAWSNRIGRKPMTFARWVRVNSPAAPPNDAPPEPPAGLADTRAAMETARILADAIDCAAASVRDPRAASVRMLRTEAGRVRAAADTVPPGIARRYRMAAEMLKTLADSRDDAPAEIQPAAAVHRKPAAPIASRRPGRLAAREIRGADFRPHRAGRLAAAPRGAVHSIGCAGLAARAAPMAAPGPGVRSAAGPGPPSGSTPLPADSRTPTARRFPRKPLTRFPQIPKLSHVWSAPCPQHPRTAIADLSGAKLTPRCPRTMTSSSPT